MNLLLAGTPQVLHSNDWLAQMKLKVRDVGEGTDEASVAGLSEKIVLKRFALIGWPLVARLKR